MADEPEAGTPGSEDKLYASQWWFVGGTAISFAVTLGGIMFIPLVAALVALSSYFDGALLGFETAPNHLKSRLDTEPQFVPVQFQILTPTQTSILTLRSAPLPPKSPSPKPAVAMATQPGQVNGSRVRDFINQLPLGSGPFHVAVAIKSPQELAKSLAGQVHNLAVPAVTANPPVKLDLAAAVPQEPRPPAISANSYHLIPLEGQRESRPAADHGDLNLKLRAPQPIPADLNLIDINGSGLDPDAPHLGAIFKPDFVRAYTVHDWDWGCNCQGQLLREEHAVLLGIRTTPGTPVFIPPRNQNVYVGKYYATLLYASEDSLTFVYTRAGSVARGYTIHYLGLQTDPNLLALFRQSQGNQLPGLTLNTPVGTATAELIVAVRDNGSFLDVRSRQDWWQ